MGVLVERTAGEVVLVVEVTLVRIAAFGVGVRSEELLFPGFAGVEAFEVTRLRGGVAAVGGLVGFEINTFFSADGAAGPRRTTVLLTSC